MARNLKSCGRVELGRQPQLELPQMRIIILEDNADRRTEMAACLRDLVPQYAVEFFVDAARMQVRLSEGSLADVILIVLDHDLELIPTADGALFDPGCGRDISSWLTHQEPICPVLIHTTNSSAGQAMQDELREAGWTVGRVIPYGDTEWIWQTWRKAARDLIVTNVAPASAPARLFPSRVSTS